MRLPSHSPSGECTSPNTCRIVASAFCLDQTAASLFGLFQTALLKLDTSVKVLVQTFEDMTTYRFSLGDEYSDDLENGSGDEEIESLSTGGEYFKNAIIQLCCSFFCIEVYLCPDGWTQFGNRTCFKRVSARKTWHISLKNCESMGEGASLARILSLEERNELSLNLLNGERAWIGLNDMTNEGNYVWADQSPLTYVNWNSSEVETDAYLEREKDCVAATRTSWQSISCSEMKPSLCFMPAISGMSIDVNVRTILYYVVGSSDYDECSNNASNCHANATCENALFSYMCTCKPGFSGNGTSCEGNLHLL